METTFDEGNRPVLNVAPHQLELLPASGQDEVVREALAVIEKVILDHVAAVSEAQDEVLMTEVGVVLHHMPQNRPVADGDHGLGHVVTGLTDPHTETATKKHDLHPDPPELLFPGRLRR